MRRSENFSLYRATGGFHNQSNLPNRWVDYLYPQLSSVRQGSATSQSNLEQIFHKIFTAFENLNEQTKYGETRRQDLGDQIGQLSKVIIERKSGFGERKGQTMEAAGANVGKRVDSRNSRDVGKSKTSNFQLNWGKCLINNLVGQSATDQFGRAAIQVLGPTELLTLRSSRR